MKSVGVVAGAAIGLHVERRWLVEHVEYAGVHAQVLAEAVLAVKVPPPRQMKKNPRF